MLDQRARGAQANALAEQIRHLSVLSEFRFSLARERSVMHILEQSERLRIDRVQARAVFGVDLEAQLRAAAQETDESAAVTAEDPRLGSLYEQVRLSRMERLDTIEHGLGLQTRVDYADLEAAVRHHAAADVRRARTLVREAEGRGHLQVTITVLEESLRLHDGNDAQMAELFRHMEANP